MSFVESNCGRNSTGRGKFIGRTTEHAEGNERKNRDSKGKYASYTSKTRMVESLTNKGSSKLAKCIDEHLVAIRQDIEKRHFL